MSSKPRGRMIIADPVKHAQLRPDAHVCRICCVAQIRGWLQEAGLDADANASCKHYRAAMSPKSQVQMPIYICSHTYALMGIKRHSIIFNNGPRYAVARCLDNANLPEIVEICHVLFIVEANAVLPKARAVYRISRPRVA